MNNKSNNNVILVAGVALLALLGYGVWLMFSSDLPILPSRTSTSEELTQEKMAATPVPDAQLESQPELSSETDTSSIETDLQSTVILDEDFSDLEE